MLGKFFGHFFCSKTHVLSKNEDYSNQYIEPIIEGRSPSRHKQQFCIKQLHEWNIQVNFPVQGA